jgi:hypothetical protein
MSYQITVKANNGSLSVTATGDVPDGEHRVSGHEDKSYLTLSAQRLDELGHHVISTQNIVTVADAKQTADHMAKLQT